MGFGREGEGMHVRGGCGVGQGGGMAGDVSQWRSMRACVVVVRCNVQSCTSDLTSRVPTGGRGGALCDGPDPPPPRSGRPNPGGR